MPLHSALFADGGLVTPVCRTDDSDPGTDWYARSRPDGGEYTTVVDRPDLPDAQETATLRVCRGAAVDLADRWAFFDGLAPAAAFVRAGRASNLMPSLDLFEAAEIRAYCGEHDREEAALLLGRQVYEQSEIRRLVARFAAAVTAVPEETATRRAGFTRRRHHRTWFRGRTTGDR